MIETCFQHLIKVIFRLQKTNWSIYWIVLTLSQSDFTDLESKKALYFLDNFMNIGPVCNGCASSNSSFGSFGSTRLVLCVSECVCVWGRRQFKRILEIFSRIMFNLLGISKLSFGYVVASFLASLSVLRLYYVWVSVYVSEGGSS